MNSLLIKVGRNRTENWALVREADPEDLWFHVDDLPSAHVILSSEAPKAMIRQCAHLCKERSQARGSRRVAVIYTRVKNIRLGRHEGEVVIKDPGACKVIYV